MYKKFWLYMALVLSIPMNAESIFVGKGKLKVI